MYCVPKSPYDLRTAFPQLQERGCLLTAKRPCIPISSQSKVNTPSLATCCIASWTKTAAVRVKTEWLLHGIAQNHVPLLCFAGGIGRHQPSHSHLIRVAVHGTEGLCQRVAWREIDCPSISGRMKSESHFFSRDGFGK